MRKKAFTKTVRKPKSESLDNEKEQKGSFFIFMSFVMASMESDEHIGPDE
jgi:hypothetical protein